MDIITMIQTLGFPIACVVACGWFIYKMWTKSTDQNEKREEKLYMTLGEVNATNKEISETNRMLVEQFTSDMTQVREDIAEIKEVILQK